MRTDGAMRMACKLVEEAAARRKQRDEQEKADRQRILEKADRLRGMTK